MRAIVLLLPALLALGGCFDQESKPDVETVPTDVVRGAVDVTDTSGEVTATKTLPDLTGTVYLATLLAATEPTDKLNEAWAAMLSDHTLAIAFVVVAHDLINQTVELDLASAGIDYVVADGESEETLSYSYALEPVHLTLQLQGTEFIVLGTFEIDLFPMAVNKPFHVHGAVGSGTVSKDGQSITELRLEGFLAEEQMEDFCLHIPGLGDVNFHWFMNLANHCAETDSDGDGEPDSYLFKGSVEAMATDSPFSPDINPIEPLISNCNPHAESCQITEPPA
jgi:hypothetical protein